MNKPEPLADTTEFVKSLVRPFLIISSWIVVLQMYASGGEPPPFLQGVATAIAGEYIIERAIKRLKK